MVSASLFRAHPCGLCARISIRGARSRAAAPGPPARSIVQDPISSFLEEATIMSTTVNPPSAANAGKPVQNPLKELIKFGQSVWLDYIRRDLLTSGELKRLIEEDGLRGMTSNPSIFEKAIGDSTLYSDILQSLRSRTDLDAKGRYEILAIRDIQDAADILRPVYQDSKPRDGYLSLEVSPYLAR